MPHGKLGMELYGLMNDPGEASDVADLHTEVVSALSKKLTGIVRNGRTNDGKSQRNDTGYWQDLTWMREAEYEPIKQHK